MQTQARGTHQQLQKNKLCLNSQQTQTSHRGIRPYKPKHSLIKDPNTEANSLYGRPSLSEASSRYTRRPHNFAGTPGDRDPQNRGLQSQRNCTSQQLSNRDSTQSPSTKISNRDSHKTNRVFFKFPTKSLMTSYRSRIRPLTGPETVSTRQHTWRQHPGNRDSLSLSKHKQRLTQSLKTQTETHKTQRETHPVSQNTNRDSSSLSKHKQRLTQSLKTQNLLRTGRKSAPQKRQPSYRGNHRL
jgi:hypothetical protein